MGFYDENAEWVGLEGIQIVGSVSSVSLTGRHSLTTRFTSRMHIYAVDYPTQEQLRVIYSHILTPVIHGSLKDHAVWGSISKIRQLIGSMVQLLEALRTEFNSDVYGNCRFTPVDLTRILRKDWGIHDISTLEGVYYVTGNHTSDRAKMIGKSLERLSSEEWLSIAQRNIKLYNSEVRELDIVIFQEVLDNLSKVDRVLSQQKRFFITYRDEWFRSSFVSLNCCPFSPDSYYLSQS
ncbi:cytoplasmic dynein 2 heavy chain 1 [Caerostris extrusa]|uniref:Cytoplasmic dynein 2 heavy chain 1 n=1 Tax=Caerostris extrusa TaxID=172846 RepID=A0AAV4UJ30_CAEEX|nr:cytoplasmic dynein 2 heavy chain 1 [Caerostris extrusa]